jgi:hypothetical protein
MLLLSLYSTSAGGSMEINRKIEALVLSETSYMTIVLCAEWICQYIGRGKTRGKS